MAGRWRRVEGDSVVAIGAWEKVRVVAAVARRCVLVAEVDVREGRARALDRQRDADLEAILGVVVVVVLCVVGNNVVVGGVQADLQMLSSASQSRHSPYSAMTPLPRCCWPAQWQWQPQVRWQRLYSSSKQPAVSSLVWLRAPEVGQYEA